MIRHHGFHLILCYEAYCTGAKIEVVKRKCCVGAVFSTIISFHLYAVLKVGTTIDCFRMHGGA